MRFRSPSIASPSRFWTSVKSASFTASRSLEWGLHDWRIHQQPRDQCIPEIQSARLSWVTRPRSDFVGIAARFNKLLLHSTRACSQFSYPPCVAGHFSHHGRAVPGDAAVVRRRTVESPEHKIERFGERSTDESRFCGPSVTVREVRTLSDLDQVSVRIAMSQRVSPYLGIGSVMNSAPRLFHSS